MICLIDAISVAPRAWADGPADLAPPRARLLLSCDPVEALVTLQALDAAPALAPGGGAHQRCGDELVVPPGRYRLFVQALGHEHREVLSLGAGVTRRQVTLVEVASARRMGTLRVELGESPSAQPSGAWPLDSAASFRFRVDGKEQPLAALQQGMELPPGRYQLEVTAERGPPSPGGSPERPVLVHQREVILPGPPVHLSLFAQLQVRHCPEGASLSDGQRSYEVPTDDDVLVRPQHEYVITCRKGIRTDMMRVRAEAGETVELDFSGTPFDRARGYKARERGSPLSARVLSQSEWALLLSFGFPQHVRMHFALGLIDQPFRAQLTALELGVEAATRFNSLAVALSIRALIYEHGRIAVAGSALFGGSYEWSHGQSTVEQLHSLLFSYFAERGPALTLQGRLLVTGDRLCPDVRLVKDDQGATSYTFVPPDSTRATFCTTETRPDGSLRRPELVNRTFALYPIVSVGLEQRLGRRLGQRVSLFLQVDWSPLESFGHPRRLWHPEAREEGGGWERGFGAQAGLIVYSWRVWDVK